MNKPLSEELRAMSEGLMSATRWRIPSAETVGECADRAALLEREVEELREALIAIGDNCLSGDPVWYARHVLGRYHFADAATAPAWFKREAEEAQS